MGKTPVRSKDESTVGLFQTGEPDPSKASEFKTKVAPSYFEVEPGFSLADLNKRNRATCK